MIYCAAHSGSGFLARVLADFGVFIGSNRNGQEDSLDLYKLLEYSVGAHFPDYARLMHEGDPALAPLVRQVFRDHLSGWTPGTRWGWKLPETGYMLPIIDQLFPTARYIHLIRDGRDVALSPFIAPNTPFWRKMYFGTDDITAWQAAADVELADDRRHHAPETMGGSTHAVPATLIAAGVTERTLPVTVTVRGGAVNATLAATSAAMAIPSSGSCLMRIPSPTEGANSAHG